MVSSDHINCRILAKKSLIRQKVVLQHLTTHFFHMFQKWNKKQCDFSASPKNTMIDGFHQRYGIRSLELGSPEIGTIAGERYMVAP